MPTVTKRANARSTSAFHFGHSGQRTRWARLSVLWWRFNTSDTDANRILGRLNQVAEDYRNTFGHGGFDKHGATIGIQIEGVAPIPARLTDVRRSPHFDLYPFALRSFREVTAALDEVDHFLNEHPNTKFAVTFIKNGFDVPFDPDSRREYADAMKTKDSFARFLVERSEEIDRIENMEF